MESLFKRHIRAVRIMAISVIIAFLANELSFASGIAGPESDTSTLIPLSFFDTMEEAGSRGVDSDPLSKELDDLAFASNSEERAALAYSIRCMRRIISRYDGIMSDGCLEDVLKFHVPEEQLRLFNWEAAEKKGNVFNIPFVRKEDSPGYSLIYEARGRGEVDVRVEQQPRQETVKEPPAKVSPSAGKAGMSAEEAYRVMRQTGHSYPEEELEDSLRFARAIESYPIEKVLVVGAGLKDLPVLLALMGKEVVFVDMVADSLSFVVIRDELIMNKLKQKGLAPARPARYLQAEIGEMDLASHGVEAGSFDLVTFAELIGAWPRGEPEKWFLKAGELIGDEGYILLDELDENNNGVVETFRQVFPASERAAGGERFTGGYNGTFGDNRLYRVTHLPEDKKDESSVPQGAGRKTLMAASAPVGLAAILLGGFNPMFFVAYPIAIYALTVHEYAHARVAYHYGDDTALRKGRLSLNPTDHMSLLGSVIMPLFVGIGWAKPVPVNFARLTRKQQFRVAAAGPAANFTLAGISGLLLFSLSSVLPPVASTLLAISFYVNIILGTFNLLPIGPLDGSRMIEAGLKSARSRARYQIFQEYLSGFILSAVVFFLAYRIGGTLLNAIPAIYDLLSVSGFSLLGGILAGREGPGNITASPATDVQGDHNVPAGMNRPRRGGEDQLERPAKTEISEGFQWANGELLAVGGEGIWISGEIANGKSFLSIKMLENDPVYEAVSCGSCFLDVEEKDGRISVYGKRNDPRADIIFSRLLGNRRVNLADEDTVKVRWVIALDDTYKAILTNRMLERGIDPEKAEIEIIDVSGYDVGREWEDALKKIDARIFRGQREEKRAAKTVDAERNSAAAGLATVAIGAGAGIFFYFMSGFSHTDIEGSVLTLTFLVPAILGMVRSSSGAGDHDPPKRSKKQTRSSRRTDGKESKWDVFERFISELDELPDAVIEQAETDSSVGNKRKILFDAGVEEAGEVDTKYLISAISKIFASRGLGKARKQFIWTGRLQHGGQGRHLHCFEDQREHASLVVKIPSSEEKLRYADLYSLNGARTALERLGGGLAADTMIIDARQSGKPLVFQVEPGRRIEARVAVVQEKLLPLIDHLKHLARKGCSEEELNEAFEYIERFKDLAAAMYKRGIVDSDRFDILGNYGIRASDNSVAILDLGEITDSKHDAEAFLESLDDYNELLAETLEERDGVMLDPRISRYYMSNPLKFEDFIKDGKDLFGSEYDPERSKMIFPYTVEEVRQYFGGQKLELRQRQDGKEGAASTAMLLVTFSAVLIAATAIGALALFGSGSELSFLRTFAPSSLLFGAMLGTSAVSGKKFIDLDAVEAGFEDVKNSFERINIQLRTLRDDLDGVTIKNMLLGYRFLNRILDRERDLSPSELLELNKIVLYGHDIGLRYGYSEEIDSAKDIFARHIDTLWKSYKEKEGEPVWERAADMYVRILSLPRIFIDGNQRTAALMAGFISVRAGLPPFVLNRENAVEYFDLSAGIKFAEDSVSSHIGRILQGKWKSTREEFEAFLQRAAKKEYLTDDILSAEERALEKAEKEIWRAWETGNLLPVEITGIGRYALTGAASGFRVSYKGLEGFIHKKDTAVDFYAPEEDLEVFVGIKAEVPVIDPGDREKGKNPRFSLFGSGVGKQDLRASEDAESIEKINRGKSRVPKKQKKRSKVNRLSRQVLRQKAEEQLVDMEARLTLEQVPPYRDLPDGSPLSIFRALREENTFLFPEDIRLRTKGKMPDGRLSIETVKRDLGTLFDLGVVDKFGLGEDAVYIAKDLSFADRYTIETLLAELGTRPSAAEKRFVRERLDQMVRISEELDKRASEARLLHPVYVADDMAIKAIVNPESLPVTAVYGAAGTDISNFLLSTDATEGYFISHNEDLKVFEAPRIDAYRLLENPNAADDISEADKMVYRRKFSLGFSTAWNIISADERILALALELEAIGASDVKVDLNGGFPRISFNWAYHGEQQKERGITFIEADMTDPDSYPEFLREVFEKGVDVYYQRAALRMPKAYLEENNFIEYVNGHLKRGGFFVTDDNSFYEDGLNSPENYTARSKDFPIELEEISVPGRSSRRRAIADLRIGMASESYGWELVIRKSDRSHIEQGSGMLEDTGEREAVVAPEYQDSRSFLGNITSEQDLENPLERRVFRRFSQELTGKSRAQDLTERSFRFEEAASIQEVIAGRLGHFQTVKGYDLGSGMGWMTRDIEKMLKGIFREVDFTGIEYDEEAVAIGEIEGLPVVKGDVTGIADSLQGTERPELITCVNPEPSTVPGFIAEARKMIAPGGMIAVILSYADMNDLMEGRTMFGGFSARQVREALSDFTLVHLDSGSPEWEKYDEEFGELYGLLSLQPFLFVYSSIASGERDVSSASGHLAGKDLQGRSGGAKADRMAPQDIFDKEDADRPMSGEQWLTWLLAKGHNGVYEAVKDNTAALRAFDEYIEDVHRFNEMVLTGGKEPDDEEERDMFVYSLNFLTQTDPERMRSVGDHVREKLREAERTEDAEDEASEVTSAEDIGQMFIDSIVKWIEVRAVETKEKEGELIIGIDTSWIPEEQRAMSGMRMILRRIEALSKSRIKGFRNIKVVVDSSPLSLADNVVSARKADRADATLTPLSNIVLIGGQDVLDSSVFDAFRAPKSEDSAFFAKVRIPGNMTPETDIDIVLLTARVLERASGIRSEREFYVELPAMGEWPIHELADIYKRRSEALIRA